MEEYKYRIKEFIEAQPYTEAKFLKKIIPRKLGIGVSTFYLWMNIKKEEKRDIPFGKLKEICSILNVSLDEIYN